MDQLGQRLINDRAAVRQRRERADDLEKEAAKLRREADEIERITELSRLQRADIPRLKPADDELVVECPKCGRKVSETCCAFQDYDYYKDCHEWIMSGRVHQQRQD